MSATEATDPGPFGIDTPEHSDRDREMFVLGVEYAETKRRLLDLKGRRMEVLTGTIHAANVPRIVAFALWLGIEVAGEPLGDSGWYGFSARRKPT